MRVPVWLMVGVVLLGPARALSAQTTGKRVISLAAADEEIAKAGAAVAEAAFGGDTP